LDIFEKYDTLREIYYDGIGYADIDRLEQIEKYQKDPAMQRYICTTRRPVESTRVKFETENRGLDKIQALFVSQEDKLEAWESIESQVGDVEVTGALSNNIEVNAKGIHKGSALQFLGELLGISMDEVITFGDGSNDIKMLEMAGTGVAMANSVQKVLDIADITAMSNDEDGVARIIEQYVLE
jgi:Cof subfamily protein (haloacid dehalogenase superfamily)